jgi:hypothetical protein
MASAAVTPAAVKIARSITCEYVSGGFAGHSDAVTQTVTVFPAWTFAGAGTLPMCCVPSDAAHRGGWAKRQHSMHWRP